MGNRKPEIDQIYGDRIRIRVSGILIQNEEILLVNHSGLTESNTFWSPPGGGLKYGESLIQCLEREFREETGLNIIIDDFLFINEFISHPLHAVEIFFKVKKGSGTLITGTDPEMPGKSQIIKNVEFLSNKELTAIPKNQKHKLFSKLSKMEDLFNKTGYFRFQ